MLHSAIAVIKPSGGSRAEWTAWGMPSVFVALVLARPWWLRGHGYRTFRRRLLSELEGGIQFPEGTEGSLSFTGPGAALGCTVPSVHRYRVSSCGNKMARERQQQFTHVRCRD